MTSSIKIGRDNSNDVIINEPSVSRNHALITGLGNDTYEVKDLGSSNGTFVNGERISQRTIGSADRVQVANCMVDWLSAFKTAPVKKVAALVEEAPFSAILKTVMIGSGAENDIVLDNPFVSTNHAKISVLKTGDYYIEDMGSSNGTFVNSARIMAKNFSRTDLVKLANTDLPDTWFEHNNLQHSFFKDHKRALLFTTISLVLISVFWLSYVNRRQWFGWDSILSANEVFVNNQQTLVHIEHDYFYTILFNNIKYYVGRNKYFNDQTEANTDKKNLLPYGTITGNGVFVTTDGTVLTSRLISNPWLNEAKKTRMLQEVIFSKTIKGLTTSGKISICGETNLLRWMPNGVVYNQQNFVEASAVSDCRLTGNTNALLQSVKKNLPDNAKAATIYFDTTASEYLHHTDDKYYSAFNINRNGAALKDTFYSVKDTLNINRNISLPLPHSLPPVVTEGSAVFNSRGELIGLVEQQNVLLLPVYIKQLKH